MEMYFIMVSKVIPLLFSAPGFSFKTLLQQDVKKGRGYRNSSDSRYDDGRGYSLLKKIDKLFVPLCLLITLDILDRIRLVEIKSLIPFYKINRLKVKLPLT
jgi:hypothetical protein